MSRPNPTRIRYDRETLIDVLTRMEDCDPKDQVAEYERVRADGPDRACQSLVWHGPGHQSSTYCEARGGRHDIAAADSFPEYPEGAVVHLARLPSGGFAEWIDEDPYDRSY